MAPNPEPPSPEDPVQGFEFRVPGRGQWWVQFRVEKGRRIGLSLSSTEDPPREVTGALLRDVGTRFGSLTAKDSTIRKDFYRFLANDAKEDVRTRAKARRLTERQGPRRMGRPPTYDLVRVAEVYATAVARRDAAPVKAVADATGASRPYASKLVRQARERGYLPNEGER